jgi:hypothetical protein
MIITYGPKSLKLLYYITNLKHNILAFLVGKAKNHNLKWQAKNLKNNKMTILVASLCLLQLHSFVRNLELDEKLLSMFKIAARKK